MNEDKPDNVIEINDMAALTRKLKRRQIIDEIVKEAEAIRWPNDPATRK